MKKVNVQKELNNLLGSLMLISVLADEAIEETQNLLKSLPKEEAEEGKTDPKKVLSASKDVPTDEEIDKTFDEAKAVFKKLFKSPLFGGK